MPKTFKITEAQRNHLMSEGVAITQNIPLKSDGSGIDSDKFKTAAQEAEPNTVFTTTAKEASGNNGTQNTVTIAAPTNEHRIVTKKELQTNRLRYLKENSDVFSFNDFLKQLH